MQARFYAPWYGRFLSPDPARDQHFEETQSWNIYSYVRNNPITMIDPDGQNARVTVDSSTNSVRIVLPVVLNSRSVSPAQYKAAIEAGWNNQGKGWSVSGPGAGMLSKSGISDPTYKVSVEARVVSSSEPKAVAALNKEFGSSVNNIKLSDTPTDQKAAVSEICGRGVLSQVNGAFGAFRNFSIPGSGDVSDPHQNVWLHETGHQLGLQDVTRGGNSSAIMKNSGSGVVDGADVKNVLSPVLKTVQETGSKKRPTVVDINSSK